MFHEPLNDLVVATKALLDDAHLQETDDADFANKIIGARASLRALLDIPIPPDPNMPTCKACGWAGYRARPMKDTWGVCPQCHTPIMPYRTICVDFDGPIHGYTRGWQDGELYDDPPVYTKEALAWFKAQGFRVVVQTARNWTVVEGYLKNHGLAEHVDLVTTIKPVAEMYIDDRGLRFRGWDRAVEEARKIMNIDAPSIGGDQN